MSQSTNFNTGNSSQRAGQHINKSLFFLTQVISQKADQIPDTQISYRNSPLTKILKNSIGGNARTLVILCVKPGKDSAVETEGTLRLGVTAKKVMNRIKGIEEVQQREEDDENNHA